MLKVQYGYMFVSYICMCKYAYNKGQPRTVLLNFIKFGKTLGNCYARLDNFDKYCQKYTSNDDEIMI